MKKLPILLAAVAAMLTLGPVAAQAATFNIATPNAVVGDFTASIQVSDLFAGRDITTDAILGFGFDVAVSDPTKVAFTGATSGPLFDAATSIPGTSVVAFASGFGVLPGTAEPILLATLHFHAIQPGLVSIIISSDILNPNEGLQYLNAPFAQTIAGTLTTTIVSTVPEPTTLVLSLSGLIGLVAARRRARRA